MHQRDFHPVGEQEKTGKNLRRARSASVNGTASSVSPILGEGTRGKKRKNSGTMERSPLGKKKSPTTGNHDDLFEKMTRYMDAKFGDADQKMGGVSNKVDGVSAALNTLTGQVAKNSTEISSLQTQINALKAAPVDGIRRHVQKIMSDMGENENKTSSGEILKINREIEMLKENAADKPATGGVPSGDMNVKEYWSARKAIRIWPITGRATKDIWEATGRFFFNILGIPECDLEEKSVVDIRRVAPTNNQKKRKSRTHDEVVVYLRDVETRDMIRSYAPSLAQHRGTAGMRLEIPCYLTGHFKCLERYGHLIKKIHGENLKWHVNFDDVELSLKLSVRMPDAESWESVDFRTAREGVREMESASSSAFRGRIRSSVSSMSAGEQQDDVIEVDPPAGVNPSTLLPNSTTLEKYKTKQARAWGSNNK